MGQMYDQATGLILPTRGGGGGGGGSPLDLTKSFDDFDVWARAGGATAYNKFGWATSQTGVGASTNGTVTRDSRDIFAATMMPGLTNTGRAVNYCINETGIGGQIFFDDLAEWNYYFYAQLSQVPDGSDGNIFVDMGFSDAFTGSSVGTNYVMARFISAASPNWILETKKASALAVTTVVSSVPVTTNRTSFRIRVYNNGGTKTAELYVDGVLAATVITNIPDTSSNGMGLFKKIQNQGITTVATNLYMLSHVRLKADFAAGRFL